MDFEYTNKICRAIKRFFPKIIFSPETVSIFSCVKTED